MPSNRQTCTGFMYCSEAAQIHTRPFGGTSRTQPFLRTYQLLLVVNGTRQLLGSSSKHLRLLDLNLPVSIVYDCEHGDGLTMLIDMFRNNIQKAGALKAQARQLVNADLAKVTHDENAVMPWKNYEVEIQLKKGLRLAGWDESALGPIRNPSLLSSSLPPLEALLRGLKSGDCRFEAIPWAEWRKMREEAKEKEVRSRKRRSDMGKKRGPRKQPVRTSQKTRDDDLEDDDEDDDEDDGGDEDDEDEDEDQEDQEDDEDDGDDGDEDQEVEGAGSKGGNDEMLGHEEEDPHGIADATSSSQGKSQFQLLM